MMAGRRITSLAVPASRSGSAAKAGYGGGRQACLRAPRRQQDAQPAWHGHGSREAMVPDSGGRFLRARLRALPVMGGLLPVHWSHISADVVAGIGLAAVSIPV